MVHSITQSTNETHQKYVETLLAYPRKEVDVLIAQCNPIHSQEFLQFLKDNYVTEAEILKDPQKAEIITYAALLIAAHLSDQAAAMALAQWMRGIWATHYPKPADAVILFRSALPFYEATKDMLSVARLLLNLVGVLTNVGKYAEAEAGYHQARQALASLPAYEPRILVTLEQNYGWLLHCWGRYAEAVEVYACALALATQHDLIAKIVVIRVNLHLTLGQLGRFAEVEEGFLQDRAIAEKAGQKITVARIDMDLGELYTILGRPAEALRRFEMAERGFGGVEQGFLLFMQAALLRHLGVLPAARKHYDSALQIFETDQLKTFYAEALVNLASCLRLSGSSKELRRATKLLTEAQSHWESLGNEYWLVQVYFEKVLLAQASNDFNQASDLLANPPPLTNNPRLQAEFRLLRAEIGRLIHRGQGNVDSIEKDFKDVLAYAEMEGLHWLYRNALIGLGRYYLDKSWSAARNLLEEAAEIDDQLRQTLSLEELKAGFHEQANDLFDDLIQQAYERQEYDRLLQYVWRAKGSAFLELALSKRDEAEYTVEQRQAIEILRQQIASLRWSLARSAEKNLLDARYEESNPELAELLDRLLKLRRQGDQQTVQMAALTFQQIKEALVRMDADLLLEFARCGEKLFGICATHEGVQAVVELVEVETIVVIAGQLALSFHSVIALSDDERARVVAARQIESKHLLQQCYQLLVAPLLDPIANKQTPKKVLVAPCDTVSTLPFAAFWTGENYWIETQEIELIQSGALLLLNRPTTSAFSRSIAIGASTGNVKAVLHEAEAVAQELGECDTFLDKPVLKYLDSLPKPPRILHIAAHSIRRHDAPLFTGVELADGILSVEHCYELPLWGTEMVTLSGCLTAGGMESDASLLAFQSALLIAGAKRVLCTLWPIADSVPEPMMVYLYSLVKEGMTIPAALRQTQLRFSQVVGYEHPALWAAFTCIRR